MNYLVFQLQAPFSSWGEVAVGEYRGSLDYPGESALLGLLGAALGLRREDEESQEILQKSVVFAVGVQNSGQLLRDYHTAQVPGRVALKGRPHATRQDELSVPKEDLNTILSTRDYRQNAAYLVAVQEKAGNIQAAYTLDTLEQAVLKPHFVLYLGRKSSPLAAPLFPQKIEAESVYQAFLEYNERRAKQSADKGVRELISDKLIRMIWADGIQYPGKEENLSVSRKDHVIKRRRWQFGDRTEHIHVFAEQHTENKDEACTLA